MSLVLSGSRGPKLCSLFEHIFTNSFAVLFRYIECVFGSSCFFLKFVHYNVCFWKLYVFCKFFVLFITYEANKRHI